MKYKQKNGHFGRIPLECQSARARARHYDGHYRWLRPVLYSPRDGLTGDKKNCPTNSSKCVTIVMVGWSLIARQSVPVLSFYRIHNTYAGLYSNVLMF